MTSSRKKVLSLIVLFVLNFVIFSSSCFMISHTGHYCSGEYCPVCMDLAECHKILHTLGTAFSGAIEAVLMLCIAVLLCNVIRKSDPVHTTLISLKVELLD